MMPLLPPSEMLYSNSSSNHSNWSAVTRSPASCGSTQTREPSLTCQPERTPSRLKLCQPSKFCPLNKSCQPAFLSSSERVLAATSAAAGLETAPAHTNSAPTVKDG